MSDTQEITQYVEVAVSQAEELVVQAKNLVIHNGDEADGAGAWLKETKSKYNALETKRKEIVKPINDSVKRINDLFNKPKSLFESVERHIKGSLLDWNRRESDRIQAEQEAEERKAEAKRKRMETWAQKNEEKGNLEKAEEFRAKAEDVEVEVTQEKVVKPTGTFVVKRWEAEVTDKQKLIKAIVDGHVSDEAVDPNVPFLNGLARRLKGAVTIPGVRFKETKGISSR